MFVTVCPLGVYNTVVTFSNLPDKSLTVNYYQTGLSYVRSGTEDGRSCSTGTSDENGTLTFSERERERRVEGEKTLTIIPTISLDKINPGTKNRVGYKGHIKDDSGRST